MVLLAGARQTFHGKIEPLSVDDSPSKGAEITREFRAKRLTVMAILSVTLALWLTSPIHHLGAAAVSAIPLVFLPLSRILTGEDIRAIGWDTLIRVAGGLEWGSEMQKRAYLLPQARGEKVAGFALTEPGAGSDVAALASTARPVDGGYLLQGEKTWISLAGLADHVLWFARTDPEGDDGHQALTAFILETDRPGVRRGDLHGKLGIRAGSTGWLTCEQVFVPVENRLGEEGEGFQIAMACLDGGRYTVAAGSAGLIRACRDASVRYARERRAFGRPIADLQLVEQKIAGMAQSYDLARLSTCRRDG